MAHMMKHTRASCGHMFAHYDRQAEHIGNENVDRERTYLNYNLATHQQMEQGEFVRKRCSEVHCQNRKDVNVMVSWVVTAPKDLPETEYKQFFQASYDFLKKRYGMENVVSAWVHMDEKQPHMHFAFVPVVRTFKQDRKNPDVSTEWLKVSAKECVNRSDLQSFHGSLQRYLERELGHEVSVLNDATKEGNRSIEELKRQSATERLREATAEAMLREIEPARAVNMQADTILKNAQLKADGIIEQARRKANTMEEHLESVKYRKKLMHVESVINSDPKLIDAYKTAEKRLAEQKPTRSLSRGMEPPTR